MKFKSDFCIIVATGFLLAYANYFSIMNLFMPGMIKDLYLAFLVVLGLAPLFFRDRKLSKKQIAVLIPWALLICEILFNRNQGETRPSQEQLLRDRPVLLRRKGRGICQSIEAFGARRIRDHRSEQDLPGRGETACGTARSGLYMARYRNP